MPKYNVTMSLGSNEGNRLSMLSRAICELSRSGFEIKEKSRVWETTPWGVTEQPRFLNMCLNAITILDPPEMLLAVKEIEKKLGRRTDLRWGPREIDIDILFIGNEIINTPSLTVPHPLIQERSFVLSPLLEIAPFMIHPVLKKTLKDLFDKLPTEKMEWIVEL